MTSLITVINGFSAVPDAEVIAYVRAQGVQFARDVAPIWGQCPGIEFRPGGTGPPEGASPCWLEDVLDVPDALAYHDEDDKGIVYIRVGNIAGYDWRTSASHEFLEVKGDAPANIWAQVAPHVFVAYEIADPVEGDSYDVDGIPMSNWVYPAWFDPKAAPGSKLDHLGKLTKPLTMTPGGYMIVWTVTGQPREVFGAHVHEVSPGLHVHFGSDVSKVKREAIVAKYQKTGRRAPPPTTATPTTALQALETEPP